MQGKIQQHTNVGSMAHVILETTWKTRLSHSYFLELKLIIFFISKKGMEKYDMLRFNQNRVGE